MKKWKCRLGNVEHDEFLQVFADWLNKHADFDKHSDKTLDDESIIKTKDGFKPNHITKYGKGYHQAVSDIFRKLGLDYN